MIRHTSTVRIRYRDTDQMGVVYHAVYLEFCETARTDLLRAIGLPYSTIERQCRVLLPVLEYHLRLLRPARYDDLVDVTATLEPPVTARFRISYELRCGEELLATGGTVHAFTDAGTFRPVRPPRAFLDAVERATGV